MSRTSSAYPHFKFTGVHDLSTRLPAPAPLVSPQHFPLWFIRAPKGDDVDLLNIPTYNDAVRLLGEDAFDERKPYFNHQTLGLRLALQNGNACYVKRITTTGPTNSPTPLKKATAVVMATVDSNTPIYKYQRDENGRVLYNAETNAPLLMDNEGPVPIPGGVTVKFSVVPVGNMSMQMLSSPQSSQGGTTVTYPLWLMEASSNGTGGDVYGFKMWAATPNAPYPGKDSVVSSQNTLIYNAILVQDVGTSTPQLYPSLKGDPLVTFAFKPNAYDEETNRDLTIQSLVTEWNDDGFGEGTGPTLGPIGKITVFQQNLDAFLDILRIAEAANAPTAPMDKYLLDFLTATTADGGIAYGYQIDPTGDVLGANNSFYLSGGADGALDNSSYELAIKNFSLYGYNTDACPAANILKYPFSDIYDTGFSGLVKDVLPVWQGYRQNTSVHSSTFVSGSRALTHAEEISSAAVIQQNMLNQAESNIYATAAYRGTLVLQSGLLSNGYSKEVSAIFELLIKRCRYLGAGDGKMSANEADNYTLPVNNQIQHFKTMSSPNFTGDSEKEAWNQGAIFTVPCGMGQQYFYPFIHTIYPNETSVLTSDIIRHICGHVALLQARTWVLLTGRDDLTTDELFIEESNKVFNALADGVFAGKAILTPTTMFTGADRANGFSWTQSVQVTATTTRNVATFEVVTDRTSN